MRRNALTTIPTVFAPHTHPSKFMISSDNPETETMTALFEGMKMRAVEYMNSIVAVESINLRDIPPYEENYEHARRQDRSPGQVLAAVEVHVHEDTHVRR
ncbi:MAG: hypothetical protein Q9211_004019, partial [Gyalolechia sp. 1 TL-2023]